MFEFPPQLRPTASYSYSFGAGNISRTEVAGGSSRAALIYRTEKVIFSISINVTSRVDMQVFNDFYFNISEQGTKKFIMKLRPTAELEEHVCIIVPGSITVNGGGNNLPFIISMQVEAEKICAPFGGDLYKLSASGYGNLPSFFDRIALFANFDTL